VRETLGTPLFPSTHSSHLCCHERARWGRQKWVCPRVRKTLGTPLGLNRQLTSQALDMSSLNFVSIFE